MEMDATQISSDDAFTGLHDVNNDPNRAVNLLLEGIESEWAMPSNEETKRPSGEKNSSPEGPAEEENWDTVVNSKLTVGSKTGNISGRRRGGRISNSQYSDRNDRVKRTGKVFNGPIRGHGSRGRPQSQGFGQGRASFRRPINTWDPQQYVSSNLNYDNLGDWDDDEYTGSLANSQIYTSSGSGNSPPSAISSLIMDSKNAADDFDIPATAVEMPPDSVENNVGFIDVQFGALQLNQSNDAVQVSSPVPRHSPSPVSSEKLLTHQAGATLRLNETSFSPVRNNVAAASISQIGDLTSKVPDVTSSLYQEPTYQSSPYSKTAQQSPSVYSSTYSLGQDIGSQQYGSGSQSVYGTPGLPMPSYTSPYHTYNSSDQHHQKQALVSSMPSSSKEFDNTTQPSINLNSIARSSSINPGPTLFFGTQTTQTSKPTSMSNMGNTTLVAYMAPGVPPLVGTHQYIMGGFPCFQQAPITYEDLQLMQRQRPPPQIDIGSQQYGSGSQSVYGTPGLPMPSYTSPYHTYNSSVQHNQKQALVSSMPSSSKEFYSYEKQGFHSATPAPFNIGSQNSGMAPGGLYPQYLFINDMTSHHNATTSMQQPIYQDGSNAMSRRSQGNQQAKDIGSQQYGSGSQSVYGTPGLPMPSYTSPYHTYNSSDQHHQKQALVSSMPSSSKEDIGSQQYGSGSQSVYGTPGLPMPSYTSPYHTYNSSDQHHQKQALVSSMPSSSKEDIGSQQYGSGSQSVYGTPGLPMPSYTSPYHTYNSSDQHHQKQALVSSMPSSSKEDIGSQQYGSGSQSVYGTPGLPMPSYTSPYHTYNSSDQHHQKQALVSSMPSSSKEDGSNAMSRRSQGNQQAKDIGSQQYGSGSQSVYGTPGLPMPSYTSPYHTYNSSDQHHQKQALVSSMPSSSKEDIGSQQYGSGSQSVYGTPGLPMPSYTSPYHTYNSSVQHNQKQALVSSMPSSSKEDIGSQQYGSGSQSVYGTPGLPMPSYTSPYHTYNSSVQHNQKQALVSSMPSSSKEFYSYEKQGFHSATPAPFNIGSQNSGMAPGGLYPQYLFINDMTSHHNATTSMQQPIYQDGSNAMSRRSQGNQQAKDIGSQQYGSGSQSVYGTPGLPMPSYTSPYHTYNSSDQHHQKQALVSSMPSSSKEDIGSQQYGSGSQSVYGTPGLPMPSYTSPYHTYNSSVQHNQKQALVSSMPSSSKEDIGSQQYGSGSQSVYGTPGLPMPSYTSPYHTYNSSVQHNQKQALVSSMPSSSKEFYSYEKQGFHSATPAPFNIGSQNSGMAPGGLYPQYLFINDMTSHHNATTSMQQPIYQDGSNAMSRRSQGNQQAKDIGSQQYGSGSQSVYGTPGLPMPSYTSPYHTYNSSDQHHQKQALVSSMPSSSKEFYSYEKQGFHSATPAPFNIGSQNSGMAPGGLYPQYLFINDMTSHHNATTSMQQPIYQDGSNAMSRRSQGNQQAKDIGSQQYGSGSQSVYGTPGLPMPSYTSPYHTYNSSDQHHQKQALVSSMPSSSKEFYSYEKQGFHSATPAPFNIGSQNSGMAPGGLYPQYLFINDMTSHHNATTSMQQPIYQDGSNAMSRRSQGNQQAKVVMTKANYSSSAYWTQN